MNTFRSLPLRVARMPLGALRLHNLISTRRLAYHSMYFPTVYFNQTPSLPLVHHHIEIRKYATKTIADEIIEEIQEQYATAKDEFEIASEETERKTVYAADDRAAARTELDNLKAMYEEALEGAEGEHVKRRVGQRIRELDNAVEALEKSTLEE